MNDARFALLDRLERTLAMLERTFTSPVAIPAARAPASVVPRGARSATREAAVLSAAERDRIGGQLRAVREEVRALREALGIPPASASEPADSPAAEP